MEFFVGLFYDVAEQVKVTLQQPAAKALDARQVIGDSHGSKFTLGCFSEPIVLDKLSSIGDIL